MDQHIYSQPPLFSVAADAPPSTPPQPASPPSHPSYAEMITAAIVSESTQGTGGGSSERAIANYIDRVYTNLPPNHSSELTHYLKELVYKGYLVMVRNSYQLSPVVGAGADAGSAYRALAHTGSAPLDLNNSDQIQLQQQQSDEVVDSAPKRRRGRPPTKRTEPVQAPAQNLEKGAGSGLGGAQSGGGKKRGRPPKQHVIRPHRSWIMMEPAEGPFVVQAEAIVKDEFEAEEPKRRPGRPPKLTPVVPARKQAHSQGHGPGQVVEESMPVMSMRKRGRPPGRKSNVGGGVEGGGVGKARGRPKRSGLGPVARPVGKRPRGRPPRGGGVVGGVVGETRGRPKRSGLGPVARPVGKRPRGRPPRGGGGAVVTVVVGKRRGRPPKASGGAPKVRRLSASGKPMGRPRKADHLVVTESAKVQVQLKAIATDGFEAKEQKRRPGRPPKLTPVTPAQKQAHSQANGPTQVAGESMPKRRPGRPPKLTPVTPAQKQAHSQANGPAQVAGQSMLVMSRRKPGRPPGSKSNGGGVIGKTRGRPKGSGSGPVSTSVGK